MKKILIASLLLVSFLLIGQLAKQPSQVQASGDCSLTINYFDQKVYDSSKVDGILSEEYGLIGKGEFKNAVGKEQFPFVINGNQNDLQNALNLIISDVCKGKCDSKSFDISLSCDGSSSSSGDCSLTINYFDQNVYDPNEVDGILFGKYGLIGKGEFNNVVGKKQFPFVINGNQNDLQDALNLIISDVCKGNCDSKSFDISLSCDGDGPKTCHIKFTAFDTDRYSAETVDGILSNKDLYDSKNFSYDVQDKKFPIVTRTGLQEELRQTMMNISLTTCSGNCHALSLAMFLECNDNTVILPPLVSYEISEGVSSCQKGIYSLIKENVNEYQKTIRENNSAYYSALASVTNTFRQSYLGTEDIKQRKSLVEQYIVESNDLKNKKNYKPQSEATSYYFSRDQGYKETYMKCPSYN